MITTQDPKLGANPEAPWRSPAKNSIQAIDRTSVHRICSGQVIINLATAVKELIENSIDAGATNVEIRLKEHGAELIEVIDNGSGVRPQDFAGLGLKYHTSKLRQFSDLVGVETFGFRGEALSSLCALGDVSFSTRHESSAVGTKLVFDHNGVLSSTSNCPRDVGTTVSVQSLFKTLPVRQKEFKRNIKKEFSKLCQVMQGYGIINVGVRMTCSNQVGKGTRSLVLSTPGKESMKENIVSIFGSKQVSQLIRFAQADVTPDIAEDYGIVKDLSLLTVPAFHITGFLSRASHGFGRSSTDRQFYFVNKRPCDLTKVSRLVNEQYHMYNRQQYPFVALNVSSEADAVDVNVTPDKRQVLIQQEKVLLAILKSSLKVMFESNAASYEYSVTSPSISKPFVASLNTSKQGQIFDMNLERDEDSVSTTKSKATVLNLVAPDKLEGCPTTPELSLVSIKTGEERSCTDLEALDCKAGETLKHQTKEDSFKTDEDIFGVESKISVETDVENASNQTGKSFTRIIAESQVYHQKSTVKQQKLMECFKGNRCLSSLSTSVSSETKRSGNYKDDVVIDDYNSAPCTEEKSVVQKVASAKRKISVAKTSNHTASKKPKIGSYDSGCTGYTDDDDNLDTIIRKRVSKTVRFDLEALRNQQLTDITNERSYSYQTSFNARIAPEQNGVAEDELRCQITKTMFKEMDIIGQFNLGFIIAKLDNDLFIIDQHATDEKYNFETLQLDHSLKGQKLISPRLLELTAANESVLIDNIEIFRRNGFEFEINEEAQIGKRVKLSSLPVSRNWTFGVEDIEELIFMLSDAPGVLCRPSRVRQMFASRACRMSVMVGKALSVSQMKKLVYHMGDIEQPWNCPHGRPTMRHLVNTKRITHLPSFREGVGSKKLFGLWGGV